MKDAAECYKVGRAQFMFPGELHFGRVCPEVAIAFEHKHRSNIIQLPKQSKDKPILSWSGIRHFL